MSGGENNNNSKPILMSINPLEFENKRYLLLLLKQYPKQILNQKNRYPVEVELPNRKKQIVYVQLTHTLVPYKRKERDDNPDAANETRYAVVDTSKEKRIGEGFEGKVTKSEHTLVVLGENFEDFYIKSKHVKPRVAKFFSETGASGSENTSLLKHASLFHPKKVDKPNKVAVSRYFPGINLADYMKPKRGSANQHPPFADLGLPDKLVMIKNLLEALKEFHGNGQVHRDLRRENIVIDPATKKIRIVDLGFARDIGAEDDYFRSKKAECTPMEAVEGRFSPKSDLYAAGVVAWDMLFGKEVKLERIIENRDGKRDITVDELFPSDSKHRDVSMEDKKHCVDLLNGMLAANPRDRLEVSQCIANVDDLISRLTSPEPSSRPRMGK